MRDVAVVITAYMGFVVIQALLFTGLLWAIGSLIAIAIR